MLIFLLVFILQNQISVTIRFLGFAGAVPVGVALLLAAIAGLLLVAIPGGVRIDAAAPGGTARRAPVMLHVGGRRLPIVGRARLYVCGITPYDTTHLGHAATFVWADVAARVLRHLGVDVEVCRNVTDVDDVLDAAAARSGSRSDSFAAVQQFRFDRDMTALAVRSPRTSRGRGRTSARSSRSRRRCSPGRGVRARRHRVVPGAGLAERAGLTETMRPRWPTSTGHPTTGQATPSRRPVWRRARAGEAAWPSPWGAGRPGWHAECAAMALTTLGPALDLHVGGADLRYPHHPTRRRMAEAAPG